MMSQAELERNDMHQRLMCSEANQAQLSSMLGAEKQAHADAATSLRKVQEDHSMQIHEMREQVRQACKDI